eukprot:1068328-Ditylum_brightwellii.AAC.1
MLLINIIQGRKVRSRVDRFKHQGSRLYKSIRQLPSLRKTFQDVPIEATNRCRETKVEEQDGCNMKNHICLLGEQIVLANEEVAPGTEEAEKEGIVQNLKFTPDG